MRVLTLWEPWATLMALGEKRIETRSWATKYRGPLAIHAAKGGLRVRDLAVVLSEPSIKTALMGQMFEPGCVVAVVNLWACVPVEKYEHLTDKERAFGDYTPGRFAWLTQGVFRLPHPLFKKGGQGLRILSPGFVEQIKAQGWSG